MQFSKESIERYKKIHKEKYGEDLSDEKAIEAKTNLIGFFGLLLEVDTRMNPQRYKSMKKRI